MKFLCPKIEDRGAYGFVLSVILSFFPVGTNIFLSCDLDFGIWPIFKKINLSNNF